MKSASTDLIALLASQEFLMADLFSFTMADSTVARYTTADGNLTVAGSAFLGTGAQMSRSSIKTQIGVEVDSLTIDIMANINVTYGNVTIAQYAQQGGFDGSRLLLERVFMPSNGWGNTSAGTLHLFQGRTAEVMANRSGVRLTINSDLELLNIQMPRNIYQAGCIHTLYDSGCGLVKASFAISGNTGGGSTSRVIACNLSQNATYFDLGTITYSTGNNAGLSRTVKSYTPGQLTLSYPLPFTPAAGDRFTAYPGCDKTLNTCTSKFVNTNNFRGYPFIPVPEAAH